MVDVIGVWGYPESMGMWRQTPPAPCERAQDIYKTGRNMPLQSAAAIMQVGPPFHHFINDIN